MLLIIEKKINRCVCAHAHMYVCVHMHTCICVYMCANVCVYHEQQII